MNYYERYCGDYGRDTAHLDLAKHGAYTLMLDTQYATEHGLPGPYEDLYRICRAMTKAEQAAVRFVADGFFPIAEDGLRWNPRARRDIAAAQPRIASARENGKGGGRPRKNPVGYQHKTQQKPSGFPNDNPPETHAGEASPYPIHQTPEKQKQARKRAPRPPEVPIPEGFAISDRVRTWAAKKGHEALLDEYFEAFVGKVRAKSYTYVDWDDAFMNSIREDWGKVRERKTNGKHAAGAWWDSEQGILAKGKELDMTPYGGEGWPEFKARINQRLRAQSGSR